LREGDENNARKREKHAKLLALLAGTMVGTTIIFVTLSRNLQLTFKDREAAGNMLASVLKSSSKDISTCDKKNKDIITLGIPRGGIVPADIVAKKLSVDFELIFARKLRDPNDDEHAIGAITEDGGDYVDSNIIKKLQISQSYLDREKSEQLEEIKRMICMYRPVKDGRIERLKGKTVILVDDGIATGATIIAAARSIRRQEPKNLIIAAPVAPKQIVKLLKTEADYVEVITAPSSVSFRTVGQFYRNFDPVKDEQLLEIIRNRIA
jgi:putative phosphoribosyl transferase